MLINFSYCVKYNHLKLSYDDLCDLTNYIKLTYPNDVEVHAIAHQLNECNKTRQYSHNRVSIYL